MLSLLKMCEQKTLYSQLYTIRCICLFPVWLRLALVMVKFTHNGEHHAFFSKVFFFWCIYLMPCFQSDLSSRLPETADDTVPQKVKKQIHWLKECQINTTSLVSPACWAILTRLLHLAFNLLFQYVFPGLKMLFSVFTLEDFTVLSSAFT